MKQKALLSKIFFMAAAGLLVTPGPLSAQGASAPAIELAAHRAIYELTLDRANAGSNVSDIRGQLVYDFTGSSCQGYNLDTRLVTEIFDREGKSTTTDIRSQSTEDGSGNKYRFSTSQYVNSKLGETTKGVATRKARDSVQVELEKPKRSLFTIPQNALFPTQHSLTILRAAVSGLTRLEADIYDGSEKGTKVYETTSLIGRQLEPSVNRSLPEVKNAERLQDMPSWPILVSYYEKTQTQDGLPTYEVSFRMYANGVSRKLKLDYGTFALNGELSSIEFFEPKPCR